MRKVNSLEKLSEYLLVYYSKPADWGKFITTFVEHEDFDIPNEFRLQRWEQHFRHISLDLALMEINEQHPELKMSFQTYPSQGDKSDNYRFSLDKVGRLFVYSLGGWLQNPIVGKPYPCARFEKLIMVDNKPIVFDMKLTVWRQSGIHRKESKIRSCRALGIDGLLRPENYRKKLKPIREFYNGDDIGYVVVIPRDIYQQNRNHYVFKGFINSGGVIIPFYADRLQFSQEVLDNVKRYGLKVKKGKGTQL